MLTFAIEKNKAYSAGAVLIECLRYAGILSIDDSGQHETLVTIKCPKKNSTEAKLWAHNNKWYMFSLGVRVIKK